MADNRTGNETDFDKNNGQFYQRGTISGADVDRAGSTDKLKNFSLGGNQQNTKPKPNRDDFPKGLAGDASYAKAVRSWQQDEAQARAIGRMGGGQ